MVTTLVSNFNSPRVEAFAIVCLQACFSRFGIDTPSAADCRILVNAGDLPTITAKAAGYARLRHRGRYGPLEEPLQQALNQKLMIYDVLGATARQKRTLIKRFVGENDMFLVGKRKEAASQALGADLMDSIIENNRKLDWFFRESDRLLSEQKAQLRSRLTSDEQYKAALEGLMNIYRKHLMRAIERSRQTMLKRRPQRPMSARFMVLVLAVAGCLALMPIRMLWADCPPYDRTLWGRWIDESGNCRHTRTEVLIAESLLPVSFRDESGCRVESGLWRDVYTDEWVTDPGRLDIDHLVPLKEAHRSGGCRWSAEKKRAFVNDLEDVSHLLAVSASANRRKSDRDPAAWLPNDRGFWKAYALAWVRIKVRWGLTADAAELAVLKEILGDEAEVIYPLEAAEWE